VNALPTISGTVAASLAPEAQVDVRIEDVAGGTFWNGVAFTAHSTNTVTSTLTGPGAWEFTGVVPFYGLDPEVIVCVHQLVGNAIQLGNND